MLIDGGGGEDYLHGVEATGAGCCRDAHGMIPKNSVRVVSLWRNFVTGTCISPGLKNRHGHWFRWMLTGKKELKEHRHSVPDLSQETWNRAQAVTFLLWARAKKHFLMVGILILAPDNAFSLELNKEWCLGSRPAIGRNGST